MTAGCIAVSNSIVLFTKRDQEKQKQQRVAKTEKQPICVGNKSAFKGHFATKDNTIKAQTSTLIINCFYGNYIHTPYFEKLSSYNDIPDVSWNTSV